MSGPAQESEILSVMDRKRNPRFIGDSFFVFHHSFGPHTSTSMGTVGQKNFHRLSRNPGITTIRKKAQLINVNTFTNFPPFFGYSRT